MAEIRVRMAPSPTGPIHVGNVHTALFNWLFARNQGGRFILRFEDTDQERSRPEWETIIFEDLKWLGMDWDEGPDIGGPCGHYRQMERLELYQQYAQRLLNSGHAYLCYCTPEELDQERTEAQKNKVAYKYSRRCCHLSPAECQARIEAGRRPVIRFKVPDGTKVVFADIIRGPIETPTDSIGDFIIMRANGIPLYNFAVVVDDVTMKITHVIRGEGHISNTPVQVLIYDALGLPMPHFGHVGHVTGMDRAKFSKRKGEGSVRDFKEQGYLPEALLNFLALLGFTPEGSRDFVTRDELVQEFDIGRVTKAAAAFDRDKLDWMNGHYIRQQSLDSLARLALPFLERAGLITPAAAAARWDWLCGVMAQVQARVKTLAEVPVQADFFFQTELQMDPQAESKFLTGEQIKPFFQRVRAALADLEPWEPAAIEQVVRGLMEEMGLKPKESIHPIRVAVTGRATSPGLFDTLHLVGRQAVIERLGRYA